jgi:signal transduction histidine kinase
VTTSEQAPAGDELEAVVRVAATVAGVPTATLNLIDENRLTAEQAARVRDLAGVILALFGVGLSTCQRIAERHHGRITAADTPGGGTTITFTVPAGVLAGTAAVA